MGEVRANPNEKIVKKNKSGKVKPKNVAWKSENIGAKLSDLIPYDALGMKKPKEKNNGV